ncbi:site-specific integrase [Pseudonocardiaceae bacterium YIM PH 21723]|nr:site-specific integrase [Pseudonocardiaceae bacterium YIM PH 21723]
MCERTTRERAMARARGYIRTRPSTRKDGKGRTSYQAWAVDAHGGEISETFYDEDEANAWITKMDDLRLRGVYRNRSFDNMTLEKYFRDFYLVRRELLAPGTLRDLDRHFALHIGPTVGHLTVERFRQIDFQRAVNRWSKTPKWSQGVMGAKVKKENRGFLAPSYVHKLYVITRDMVTEARVLDKALLEDPCVRIKLPTLGKEEVVIPKISDVGYIFDEIADRYRVAAKLCAAAGPRRGELFGLGPEQIDRDNMRVNIERQMNCPSGKLSFSEFLKTSKAYRSIPIDQPMLDEIDEHMERWPPIKVDGKWIMFYNRRNQPVRDQVITKAIRRILDELNIPPGIAWHILRHFYASMLINSSLSIVAVQNMLGHADHNTTLKLYGHLWETDDDAVRQAVNSQIGHLIRPTAPSAADLVLTDAVDLENLPSAS